EGGHGGAPVPRRPGAAVGAAGGGPAARSGGGRHQRPRAADPVAGPAGPARRRVHRYRHARRHRPGHGGVGHPRRDRCRGGTGPPDQGPGRGGEGSGRVPGEAEQRGLPRQGPGGGGGQGAAAVGDRRGGTGPHRRRPRRPARVVSRTAEGGMTTAEEFAQVEAELAERGFTRMVFDLSRIEELLDLLGAPHRTYPSIHLTGTNGKTSTARMVDSLLRAHGLRTGRYTSPHLETVRERISLDGEPVDEERFVATYREVAALAGLIDTRCPEGRTSTRRS